jgi:glutathione S-transferase
MFEDKGVPYSGNGEGMYGPDGTMCCFRGSPENVRDVDNTVFPVFFPPAIHHIPTDGGEEVIINQVPACMQYIGTMLGYAPSSPAEKARADCILMNATDYIAEGRSSFHPVKNTMSYNDQKEEGDKASKEWSKTRMLIWLAYFEKICSKNATPTSPIAGGESLTYADFALFQVLDATVSQFENETCDLAWTTTEVPALKQFHEAIKNRPKLKAYLQADRCPKYFGDSMM